MPARTHPSSGNLQPVSERRHDFYQEGLTGVRALAATWVLLFHLNAFAGPRAIELPLGPFTLELHPLLTCGWVGVDVFFVLSGFLLATHLLQALAQPSPGLLRRYFAARVRRVIPAYWVQLAILLAVAVITLRSLPDWARYLPLHLPMLHFVSEKASWAINDVYWTLPIEFGFYLCLPLVARILARAERRGGNARWIALASLYGAALLMVWGYRYAAYHTFAASPTGTIVWAVSQLPGSFDQFMAGVAAAAGLRWWRQGAGMQAAGSPTASNLLAVAGLAGVVAMMYFVDRIYLEFWHGHAALFFWHSLTSAFAALAVLGVALGGPLTRALFETRPVVWLGTISYSVYLWHYPILKWLQPSMQGVGLAGYLLVGVPLILAASAASYYAVERPFLKRAAR